MGGEMFSEMFSTMPLQPREIKAPFSTLLLVTCAWGPYCVTLSPVLMYMFTFVALVGVADCRSEHAWHRSRDSAEPLQLQPSY
jgi:hypothetical protein